VNYYPFHVGDYAAHTAHLDLLEDLAYRRMLDLYYLRECALPHDPAEVARLIRMRGNVAEVTAVLREFFTEVDGGWVNGRCDEEILRMQDKQMKAKASAEASVAARRAKAEGHRSASAERTLNKRSTDAELPTPTPTPTPVNTPSDEGVARKRAAHPARPAEVPESVWQDFQALRKAKRAALTDTAMDGIRREAAKAGIGLADALAYCCEAGWQGFNAGWYADRQGAARGTAATGETAYQRSMRERIEEAAPSIARRAPAQQQDATDYFRTVDVPARDVTRHAIEVQP
jgi:uncharacterized protein YdaU (DUF1376 family)